MVTASDEDTVIAGDVVPGHAHDAPLRIPMLARTLDRVPGVGEVVGDTGSDGDHLRSRCRDREGTPNIPIRADRERWALDPIGGRERNRGDRRFGTGTPFRRIATRSETLQGTDRGLPHLTLGFSRLRARRNR